MKELHSWLLRGLKAGLFVFWSGLIVVVARGSVSENALRFGSDWSRTLLAVTPQGWGFFTRNPREPELRAFRQEDGEWELWQQRMGSPDFFFGLRRPTPLRMEIAGLVSEIPEERWLRCDDDPVRFSQRSRLVPVEVVNQKAEPRVCGPVLLQYRSRVPWAWSGDVNPDAMPSRIARLEVICRAKERTGSGQLAHTLSAPR